MGPVGLETDGSGVDGEEEIVVVSSIFGDPLRFSLSGGSFVRESLETPVGKVVKLLIGQVILWVQCKHGPESVRGRRRTTWSLWAHRLPRVAPQGQEHALAPPRFPHGVG